MSGSAVFELDNVSYQAGGRRIVDGVAWRVGRHEHWAVLGSNGSGKTTLLRIACGYLWPNAGGTVRRDGRELTDLRELRRSIGWVTSSLIAAIPPGEHAVDTVLSGRFGQTGLKPFPGCVPSDDDGADALRMLTEADSADLADRPFGVLSQGEQQKVLIARARMARPLLIVLDEPCAGLDPGARERFLAALEHVAGLPDCPSLILVTHHIEEIMPSFARLLVLREGRIHFQGDRDRGLTTEAIETLYGLSIKKLIREDGRTWPIW